MDIEKAKVYLAELGLSGIVAAAIGRFGVLPWVLFLYLVIILVDYGFGVAAAWKEGFENPDDKSKGLQSKKGVLGIIKKLGYLGIVFVAIMMDLLIFSFDKYIPIEMPIKEPFSLLITIMLILNELLSILENVGRMGANVPAILAKAITALKNQTEKNEDD